jgi:phosphoribosylamine--glycine ligase
MTDVLLVGSGGREHALAWKLAQSPRIGKLYIAPGNGGTRSLGENIPISATDIEALLRFAEEKRIGFTVVGPDDPLSLGIVDAFQARGLRIFGPTKAAARLESSKSFAKQLMSEKGIPTASFRVFSSHGEALSYVRTHTLPVVIKASGLALGKGVYICGTPEEAESALEEIMVAKVHKDAGSEVVIEDYLDGPEVSVHALSDGFTSLLFPPSQDHKRSLDNDEGKNTGGMGTIVPVPFLSAEGMTTVEKKIVHPTLEAMKKGGSLFAGLLYPGLKLTVDGPKVLEFNARFGDPECQVYMRLLEGDLLDLLEACADGTLADVKDSVRWARGYAANIVAVSGGYPDAYQKGFPIAGLDEAAAVPGVVIFHAGTTYDDGYKTSGGRVLGVSAIGTTLKGALDTAYSAIEKISFEGMRYRHDIGSQALRFLGSR